MDWYFKLIAYHPCIVVSTIGALSIVASVISITCSNLPNFSDPQLGFETRGTKIAKRLIAWENLYEAIRPSGALTVNPLADQSIENSSIKLFSSKRNGFFKGDVPQLDNIQPKVDFGKEEFSNEDDLSFEEDKKNGHENFDHDHDHDHLSIDGFFCEGLSSDYSHVVLETIDQSSSLLSLSALQSVCAIQQKLMNHELMNSICQTVSSGRCCNPWSLPNYLALLSNHTSCFDITEKDVRKFKRFLLDCAKYFDNLKLRSDCIGNSPCHGIPKKCNRFNALYNILYYLTDVEIVPADTSYLSNRNLTLRNAMIFLPIARSSAILPYYYNLSSSDLRDKKVQVVAMDLGLKSALFNDCLIRDAFLMVIGGGFMVLCIWSFTSSLLITISTMLAIFISLISSYFIYTFVFKIKFFPFMNLLAIVVIIGIGSDDTFIFHKIWECFNKNKSKYSQVKLISDTVKHSVASMFITSLTTAAAFYSSYISSITAIKCFGVFSGTAVLINFVLMISWVPAFFVISQKLRYPNFFPRWRPAINYKVRTVEKHTLQVKALLEKWLIMSISRLRWLWLVLFLSIAIGSAVAVLYYPKFKLPDSRNFHLFQSSHLFEKYEAKYKERFWFEKLEKVGNWDSTNFELPLRFVWGVVPADNGNYLEPEAKGTLEFDQTFDMAAPESQLWLLNFCRLLRTQPFYQPTLGPLLPNCFIESFKNWMERRCRDVINQIDRTPCCETSEFPYSRKIFKSCIVQAMSDLYETPADYFLPGVAGPKFSKTKKEIRVVVVEYNSNHSYSMSFNDMLNFYNEVESWFQTQLVNAPPGMKNGWFVSHLDFYDLQLSLSDETAFAIGMSMAVSLIVFFLVSLNVLISIYTIITISCIIFVTVAVLVLIGWSLNVLESITVTTAIGLAVDFSLHYGITYRLSVEENRESAVGFTLTKMAGPTLMAALTTGAAGVFMLPSSVLPYIQIGVFLIIVMTSSWLYSTIFLMSLFSVAGPQKGFCQFSYKFLFSCFREKNTHSPAYSNKTVVTKVLSDSVLPPANVTEESELNVNESHELTVLASYQSPTDGSPT